MPFTMPSGAADVTPSSLNSRKTPFIFMLMYPSQQWILDETNFAVLYFVAGAIHELGYHIIRDEARRLMLARLTDGQG